MPLIASALVQAGEGHANTHTHPNIHTLIIEEEKIRSQNKRKKKKWTKWTEMCLRYGIRYSREAAPLDTAIRYVRGVAYRRILFFFAAAASALN